MKSVVRIGANSKGKGRDLDEAVTGDRPRIDARAELIQALIPIGLEAVNELLQQEVVSLVGARHSRGGGEGDYARWGRQQGSAHLRQGQGGTVAHSFGVEPAERLGGGQFG